MQRASIVRLPAGLLALVVVAGSAGLFATFWDDAWHTDLGRDQATIPPHLLLYGSMAVIGAVVAAWGLVALRRSRSPAAVLRQPPLLLAAAGGTLTLVALPIDAAWHAAFGRDAVLWSPPHMLAIFGSLALLVGFLAGARPDTPRVDPDGPGSAAAGQRGRAGPGVRDRRAAVQRDAVPSRAAGCHAVCGDAPAPRPARAAAGRARGGGLRAATGGDHARAGQRRRGRGGRGGGPGAAHVPGSAAHPTQAVIPDPRPRAAAGRRRRRAGVVALASRRARPRPGTPDRAGHADRYLLRARHDHHHRRQRQRLRDAAATTGGGTTRGAGPSPAP
jgi:hypothetical protein